jgi:hypothetical protein
MKLLPLLGLIGCVAACEQPASVWLPPDTREERGPFPVGFVGSLSGPDSLASQRALDVLQRDLDGSTLRERKVELHVLDDAGDSTALAAGIRRFSAELQAPLVIVHSKANIPEAIVEPALLTIQPNEDVSAAVRRAKTALQVARHLTPKDVRAALVDSAP